jgi:exonuclease III
MTSGSLVCCGNKQAGDRNVKVRLDRAVASASWLSWFLGVQLHHLVTSRSDHLPILLELELEQDTSER